MAEIFEVSVANLLDSTEYVNAKLNQKEILQQLVIFNKQNSEKMRIKNRNRKRIKRAGIVFMGALLTIWLGLISIDIVRLKGNEDINKRPIVTTYLEGYAPEYMYYYSGNMVAAFIILRPVNCILLYYVVKIKGDLVYIFHGRAW